MFVAGPFQEMQKPMINNTRPCLKAVEGSSGKASSRIAAKGMLEPELICDRIILPEFGNRFASKSPILPPNKPPSEPAMMKRVIRKAVFL